MATYAVLELDSQFGSSGFNANPSGYRYFDGDFLSLGTHAYFWSRTEDEPYTYWTRGIFTEATTIARYAWSFQLGGCVRCLKD